MDWTYLFTSFEGRINRAKFWLGVLVLIAINIIANLVDLAAGSEVVEGMGVIGLIAALVMIYFSLALYAKRWHDRDKSGWWTLILLVPFIGWLWLLVECGCLRGTQGPNSYGPDPLAQ